MQDKKSIEERIENIEKQIQIIMSMINHINNTNSINVISEIEDVIDKAVDKKINYIYEAKATDSKVSNGKTKK